MAAWYYIPAGGAQTGPVDDAALTALYKSKKIDNEAYVWNGGSVNAWLQVKDPAVQKVVGKMFNPPKPKAAAPSKPAAPTKRPNPMGGGGGGRNALLMAIQSGKKLKKKKKQAPKCTRCNGKGVLPGGLPLPCPLCKKKKKKKKGGGGSKSPSSLKSKMASKMSGARKPSPTLKNSNTAPVKKSWKEKRDEKEAATKGGGSTGGSSGMNQKEAKVLVDRIKRMLNKGNTDLWKLKAIDKILA